jgi:hypothetical protein
VTKLIAYKCSNGPLDIRPAPLQRDWIDATPKRYGYLCTPLTIANQHGWEILCPATFEATWQDGKIEFPSGKCPRFIEPHDHFSGIGFDIDVLFCTDPGINLFVTGPLNRPKDGIAPLTAIVESDHAVTSVIQMVWLFTRPAVSVRFEEGEPFCQIFPITRGLVDAAEPEIRSIKDEDPDSALYLRFQDWAEQRRNPPNTPDGKWPMLYFRNAHQRRLKAKPFFHKQEEDVI